MVPVIGEHIWIGGAKRRMKYHPSSSGVVRYRQVAGNPASEREATRRFGLKATKGDMRGLKSECRGMSLAKVPAGEHHSAQPWGTKMRKALLFIAAILLATESSIAQETAGAPQVPSTAANSATKLGDATPVLLRTKEELSSATAKVGDRVPFRVTEDVKAGDLVVIQRGAEAWGVVTAVQPKRRKGHGGSLDVAIQSVQLLNGNPAPLRAEQHSKGASNSLEMGLRMAQYGMTGVLLPVVPFLLLEKGKDALLPAGTKFTAYLNGDMPLDRAALEHAQSAMVQRTGPATVTIFRGRPPRAIAFQPSVYCGKVALARLSNDHYLKIRLPPGKYSFRSSDDQVVELNLKEGQEVYLQMQMVTHGLSMKGHLIQVSSEEGVDELSGLHELSSSDFAKASDAALADLQAMPEKK